MTPFVTSHLSKKVILIKWVRKDLEISTVEFTRYLNSCVCLHQKNVMFLKINVIHQMFWQKHIIYIFLANVRFYLQKWHKNT